ncbi:hypothetical protein SEQMU2_00060 [Staphylococcus equorum subsp. equorum Mu2]|nr:hypothetical protein SEQMU2_00060 [Staphylococcus equorum subsp. equorum Mu2]
MKNYIEPPIIKIEMALGLVSDEMCQESVRLL